MSHQRPPQHQGRATLLRRQMITPRMMRLFFHAPDLADMQIAKPAHALHVWFGGDANDKTTRRVFTLRQFDAARAELAIDIVLHGQGTACRWAQEAQIGDTLVMAGPRSGFSWPLGGEWLLAVVDESAMPALASILDHLPHARPVHAWLALSHENDLAYFDTLRAQRRPLHLLPMSMPGKPSSAAISTAIASVNSWPTGPGVAFIAGELQWVAETRTAVTDLPGVDWLHLHASGYWSRGQKAYGHD